MSIYGAGGVGMSEIQRSRLLAATVEVVSELGYVGMSTARVSRRAGVSRRTFYELFENREDCFLAAFDDAVARATLLVQAAAGGEADWREQVRAGLFTLLQFIGEEPGLGSLVIVDALNAGPNVLARRAYWLETLARIVDQGRDEVEPGDGPPPLTADGVVGAVLSVLHAQLLLESRDRPLIELLNPLMAIVVHPYLGPAVARDELTRAIPKARRTPIRPVKDPLDGLNMRITYRTLRVLAAVADQPGGSNRDIADHAEISDAGQISRLLARLQKLGLTRNTGLGQAKGETNAWTLTPRGEEVQQSVSGQIEG